MGRVVDGGGGNAVRRVVDGGGSWDLVKWGE